MGVYNFLERVKFFGLRKIYYLLLNTTKETVNNISYVVWVLLQPIKIKKEKKELLKNKNFNFNQDYFSGKFSNYSPWGPTIEEVEKIVFKQRIADLKLYLGSFESKKILDVGCGVGYFLSACDKLGFQTYGIDISSWALEEARKYTKAVLKKIDIEKEGLPFREKFFDIVTAFDVIEHLKNKTIFFKEIYRVLKRNGILYLITPNGIQETDKDLTHVNLKKIDEWIEECRSANFYIVNSYCYKWYPPFPKLFFQKIHRLLNIIRKRYVEQAVIIAWKK